MRLRKAEKSDFDFFYKIKSEETNIFWTGWDKKPEYVSLLNWYNKVIDESILPDKKKIFIAEKSHGGYTPIGYLYIIPLDDKLLEYEEAVAVSEHFSGQGYGKQLIKMGLEEARKVGFKRMKGSIREDNIASLKAHSACGIVITEDYKTMFIPRLGREVKMFEMYYDFT